MLPMQQFERTGPAIFAVLLLCGVRLAPAQTPAFTAAIALTTVDENGAPVPGAQAVVEEQGHAGVRLTTDYAGNAAFFLHANAPYRLHVEKPGFYATDVEQPDASERLVRVVLSHEQFVTEQVSVAASTPGIDTTQTSDVLTMNPPEIVNVPYPTSRDIRNLLPFFPGVVQDLTGVTHVAGAETWETLDTLDGFDIRSPVDGALSMRVSADAVRSIDRQATRYPVEFGRATGGVIGLYTGMGDNRFRFNATDFLPSWQDINGIRFDKFVPRLTFSGPIRRGKAWFFDGLEAEYDDTYIRELPEGMNTNHEIRGSNIVRFQANAAPSNILSTGLLFNDLHSPYDGISPLVPQQSTTQRDTIGWLPYVRDQQSFHNGALLDAGFGVLRFRDGYEPHGDAQYDLTPELAHGSYFESQTSRSQRVEGNAVLYLPPRHWAGRHDLKAGIDLDHIGFSESAALAPVDYLRENGSLSRRSTFLSPAPFTRHNAELGAYLEDRWTVRPGLLIEPGLRFDWDEIVRRPLFSPRIAAVLSPPTWEGHTKLSAGVGLYYEHTQLEYLARTFNGARSDTYYESDGETPTGPSLRTTFTADGGSLREARALNWSVEAEQRLPGAVFAKATYMWKRATDGFVYADQTSPTTLYGNFALTNDRTDHDTVASIEARHAFSGGYTLFAAYTRSSARTNAAFDYLPTVSTLGPQQSGPLPWDAPNRVISWGWLPFPMPILRKSWDFVYTADWHTGFPFTAVDADRKVVGAAGGYRFPDFVSLSPGLEWRFHFRGKYFGLRGVMENASDTGDYSTVYNVIGSPLFGTFSVIQGRALTARLRLIGESK